MITKFVNILFLFGQCPFRINPKNRKIHCSSLTLLQSVFAYLILTLLCVGSHQLANHNNLKYYTSIQFTSQMLSFYMVAAIFTITIINSIKNRHHHIKTLKKLNKLTKKFNCFKNNNNYKINIFLLSVFIYEIFVIILSVNSYYYVFNVLLFFMIEIYNIQVLIGVILSLYINQLSIMLISLQKNITILFKSSINRNNIKSIRLFYAIKLIDKFELIKNDFQLSFGEQLLYSYSFDIFFVTNIFFIIILKIEWTHHQQELIIEIVKSLLMCLPNFCKYFATALIMNEFGGQVRKIA